MLAIRLTIGDMTVTYSWLLALKLFLLLKKEEKNNDGRIETKEISLGH
jgi:hypothetical protein